MIGLPSSSYCDRLVQHLRDALADAAVLLAGNEHRVDDLAAVVDRDVAHAARRGRSRESTSTTAMCEPNGNDEPSGVEVELVLQAAPPSLRVACAGSFAAAASSAHDNAARGHARDFEPAVADHDVVGARLEQVRGELLRLREHLLGSRRSSALPPIWSERDPPVPPPRGTSPVSECTTRTFSNGTPSVSLMIWRTPSRGPGRARSCRRARSPCRRLRSRPRRTPGEHDHRRADLEVRRHADAEQLRVAALAARLLLGEQRVVAGVVDARRRAPSSYSPLS